MNLACHTMNSLPGFIALLQSDLQNRINMLNMLIVDCESLIKLQQFGANWHDGDANINI